MLESLSIPRYASDRVKMRWVQMISRKGQQEHGLSKWFVEGHDFSRAETAEKRMGL
jgi:hypothetical protein